MLDAALASSAHPVGHVLAIDERVERADSLVARAQHGGRCCVEHAVVGVDETHLGVIGRIVLAHVVVKGVQLDAVLGPPVVDQLAEQMLLHVRAQVLEGPEVERRVDVQRRLAEHRGALQPARVYATQYLRMVVGHLEHLDVTFEFNQNTTFIY